MAIKKTETTTTTAPAAAAAAKPAKTPKVAKEAAAPAPAPVVVAAAPAPVAAAAASKPKKEKAVKKEAAPAKAKVSAPVVDAAASAAEVVADVSTVTADYSEFMSKLQQLSSLISTLKNEFRSLEKRASRELKVATKASSKRKRKTGNRSPSGFVKPTLISKELADFLGKTEGTEMARTEVTREINAYIRANQLQDKTNGRRINADSKLSSLLKLASGEELTYFNLQRYMSPHFAKSSAAAVATA
jgi:chromatin remodeling complex protein RSC6